jgi:propanediol dehydratase small subunit
MDYVDTLLDIANEMEMTYQAKDRAQFLRQVACDYQQIVELPAIGKWRIQLRSNGRS